MSALIILWNKQDLQQVERGKTEHESRTKKVYSYGLISEAHFF